MRVRLFLAFAASLHAAPSWAATEDRTGFGYCAPPNPPSCIDFDSTYKAPKQLRLCKEAVQRYVLVVASYRTCLAKETERAILQVNDSLDRYKCRSQPGRSACPRR